MKRMIRRIRQDLTSDTQLEVAKPSRDGLWNACLRKPMKKQY